MIFCVKKMELKLKMYYMISLFCSFILKVINKYLNFVLLILFIIYKDDFVATLLVVVESTYRVILKFIHD